VEEGKGELSLGNFIRLKITGKAEERIRRGYLLDVRGTVEEAISAYEKAIEIDPHNLVAHYILGLALESKGEFEKAMERYEKSEEVDLAKAPRKVSREIIDILNNYLGRTTKDGHKVGTILKRYIEIIGENPEKMARLLSYIEDIKLDAIANIISSYLRDEALIEAGGKIIRDEEDFAEDYEERMKLKKAKEISKEEVNLIWKYKTGRTIRCLAVSKAGGDIVGGSENGKIYFLDKHGNPVWKADAKVSIVDIDISPEGGYVVEGLYDGNVELRDSEGKMVWKADFKESGVSSVAVSEGAEYTIVATRDYQLILLNRAGEILWKHPIKGYCTRVDISSDGRNIVACSDTGELYFIKNTKEMLPIVDALKIKDTLYSVSISPDGRFYAAGSKQGKVYFMDENKRILWKREVLSHVYGVAVSENGRYVSAGTSSGLVYYFTKGGKQKWKYPTGINVWDVGISGDGEEVVAGCGLVFGNIYLFSAI
jgi:WD40 repeat protein